MNSFLKILLLIFVCNFFYPQYNVYAQGKKVIQGKVVDSEGDSLAYVNVFIQDSFDGAMSKEDGSFSFTTSKI